MLVFVAPAGVDYKLSTKITAVDTKAKTLKAESGDSITYEKLIIATGARVWYILAPCQDS